MTTENIVKGIIANYLSDEEPINGVELSEKSKEVADIWYDDWNSVNNRYESENDREEERERILQEVWVHIQ